jgi:diguanylate cyclase (GGDEF)-like protein
MSDRAEIAKRVERAEKFLQKGKPDAALEEYLAVLNEDRDNDSVRQMAADLSLSVGRTQEAVALLGDLFERQVGLGDATRASLTYKKLARYTNPSTEQKLRFGQILESSNKRMALDTYEAALQELAGKGSKPEQMNVLKRIVALEPALQNFMRLGEMAVQLGDGKGAAAAFLRVAELTEQSGANSASWYERAYQSDPSNVKVALSYGRSLVNQGEVGAAIFVLEPLVQSGNASGELRETYARALLAAGRFNEAEPHVWALFEQNPTRVQQVASLIGAMIDAQLDTDAVALARKLEQYQRRRGERRAFLALMQDIVARHRASPEILELLVELYNASNRENDYCQTLVRLFELYYKTSNFEKAGECLDRAAEVDPYEPGHQKRLEMLRGKIDEGRYKVIAARFTSVTKNAPEPSLTRSAESGAGSASLQDLMLQAEILVQYGMRAKALERLQHIQETFPQEEERNPELQRLYLAAGMTTQYPNAPAPVAPQQPAAIPVIASAAPSQAMSDVTQLTRIAEITRKLYRQASANEVLTTVAQEVGGMWKLTRCVAATRRPSQQPTAMEEYCASGVKPGEPEHLTRLVVAAHDMAIERGAFSVADAFSAADLQTLRETVSDLSFTSMLVVPLSEGSEHVGVLLLLQDVARGWHANDVVVLKTIAEQAVQALNNAGLRRLVSNLSVTDEKSRLLSRASYLDLLLGEVRRAQEENSQISVLLMQFGDSDALVRQFGVEVVETTMQQIGRTLAARIRQNDFAFRYEATTAAVILGDTCEADAVQAVEKFRRVLEQQRVAGTETPVAFAAGLAESVMKAQYDPVDIVTEVINRAEMALEQACAGGEPVRTLAPGMAAAAAV